MSCNHICAYEFISALRESVLISFFRVTLPRETNVAKSIDFSQFIRISPQASNILQLNGDAESESNSPFNSNEDHNSIASSRLQEGSPYIVSRLQADPTDEERAFSEKLHRGTWETFLVFGMICAAIIASMSSVIWFIRSYRSSGDTSNQQRLRSSDEASADSNSSYSSFEGSISLSSDPANSNLDSRSDIDVELDFEFSEDINTPSKAYTSN
jgi:hypothetical protein